MAHKTFISYKWSEAQDLRDDIITALGEDATYYKGETSESPDLTDTSTENIKKNFYRRIIRNDHRMVLYLCGRHNFTADRKLDRRQRRRITADFRACSESICRSGHRSRSFL